MMKKKKQLEIFNNVQKTLRIFTDGKKKNSREILLIKTKRV